MYEIFLVNSQFQYLCKLQKFLGTHTFLLFGFHLCEKGSAIINNLILSFKQSIAADKVDKLSTVDLQDVIGMIRNAEKSITFSL